MIVINTILELNSWYNHIKLNNVSLGFIPTMGALHEGHISLVEKSVSENDFTIVSIFVNPTQFNNTNDFVNYPITIENDTLLLKQSKCDVLFLPTTQEIYSNNINSTNYKFSGIEKVMEGKHRPGHFDGVATIVSKLFNFVKPDIAYFGEKDFQQLLIIKELVKLERIPLKVVGMPIYREENGLAMSSRNTRLSSSQREESSLIFKTLQTVKSMFLDSVPIRDINTYVKNIFINTNLKLEYFEVRENNSLKFAKKISENKKHRAFISVFVGEVRLIDNIALF
ncbi:MAG: pantoate--beta-alanine ligase [Solirubrobacteraceae bacterium]